MNDGERKLIIVAVLTAVLTSCATAGTPEAIDSERPPIPLEAPTIPEPLVVGDRVENPCETLSTDEIEELGFTDPQAGPWIFPRSCIWLADEGAGRVTLSFGPILSVRTWQDVYDDYHGNIGGFSYFVPTKVHEYPATLNGGPVDLRVRGACDITVGLASDQIMKITVGAEGLASDREQRMDPCGYARRAAEMVIERLRQG